MAGVTNKATLVMKEKGKPFFQFGILQPLAQDGGIVFRFLILMVTAIWIL